MGKFFLILMCVLLTGVMSYNVKSTSAKPASVEYSQFLESVM